MRVGVLGSGLAAQGLSARLAELGHNVVIGTRDPILVDVSNPRDFSNRFPPSLAEQIQRAFPSTKVVKTL